MRLPPITFTSPQGDPDGTQLSQFVSYLADAMRQGLTFGENLMAAKMVTTVQTNGGAVVQGLPCSIPWKFPQPPAGCVLASVQFVDVSTALTENALTGPPLPVWHYDGSRVWLDALVGGFSTAGKYSVTLQFFA